jgi:hypothetical protein
VKPMVKKVVIAGAVIVGVAAGILFWRKRG